MAAWMIAFYGLGYLVIAGLLKAEAGKWGMPIAFFGYAIGNLGLYLNAKGF